MADVYVVPLLRISMYVTKFEKEIKKKLEEKGTPEAEEILQTHEEVKEAVKQFVEERQKFLDKYGGEGVSGAYKRSVKKFASKVSDYFGIGDKKDRLTFKTSNDVKYDFDEINNLGVDIAEFLAKKLTGGDKKELKKYINKYVSYSKVLSPKTSTGSSASGGGSGGTSGTSSPSSSDPIFADTLTMIDDFDILGLLGASGTLPENLIREEPDTSEEPTGIEKIFEAWLNEIKKKAEAYKQKKKDEFEDSEKEEIYSYTMNRKQNQERVLKKQKEIAIDLIFSPLVAIATDFKNYDNVEVKKIINSDSDKKNSFTGEIQESLQTLKAKIAEFYNEDENTEALQGLGDNRGFEKITEFKPGTIKELKSSLLQFEVQFQVAKEKIENEEKKATTKIEVIKKIINYVVGEMPYLDATKFQGELSKLTEDRSWKSQWYNLRDIILNTFIEIIQDGQEENNQYKAYLHDPEYKSKIKGFINKALKTLSKKELELLKEGLPGFLSKIQQDNDAMNKLKGYIKKVLTGADITDEKKLEKIANLLNKKIQFKFGKAGTTGVKIGALEYDITQWKKLKHDWFKAVEYSDNADDLETHGWKKTLQFTPNASNFSGNLQNMEAIANWAKDHINKFEDIEKPKPDSTTESRIRELIKPYLKQKLKNKRTIS